MNFKNSIKPSVVGLNFSTELNHELNMSKEKIYEILFSLNSLYERLNSISVRAKFDSNESEERKKVVLNARGMKYEVLVRTLNNYPNSRLGKLVNMKSREEILKLCDDFQLNEFYFDRDPFVLNSVLNYFNTGKLHLKMDICVAEFEDEVKYWMISSDLLKPCCEFVYEEKKSLVGKYANTKDHMCKRFYHEENFGSFYPNIRRVIWNFFEKPDSSIYARLMSIFSIFVISISSLDIIVRSMLLIKHDDQAINLYKNFSNDSDDFSKRPRDDDTIWPRILDLIEIICVSWFVIEFTARLVSCPCWLLFFKSFLNIVDLISIVPSIVYLTFASDYLSYNVAHPFRMLRVVLMLKITRHSESLKSFAKTIKRSYQELGILLIYLLIGVLFFAVLVYFVEKDTENTKFTSIPDSFWWAIITMTTIGYGDMIPQTVLGKFFGSLCSICGILILAMPVGIVSSNFSELYQESQVEKRILKMEIERMRIEKKLKS